MELNGESVKKINLGDVVKFTYPNNAKSVGVVYGLPAEGDWGILCNREDGSHFGIGIVRIEDPEDNIQFEILSEHNPVEKVGFDWQFVKN